MIYTVAKGIAILFHPLFMVMMMLGVIYLYNPYVFPPQGDKGLGLLFISVLSLSVVFPLISVLLMRMLGLIRSLEMHEDKERIGPLIATGIFYLWLYVNIKDNSIVPEVFAFFVLGTTIGLFFGFFMNNFIKVSIHGIGISGFLIGLLFVRHKIGYDHFILPMGRMGQYIINSDLLIILTVVAVGLVGTARLIVKAHTTDELYGGYSLGAMAMFLAYMVYY